MNLDRLCTTNGVHAVAHRRDNEPTTFNSIPPGWSAEELELALDMHATAGEPVEAVIGNRRIVVRKHAGVTVAAGIDKGGPVAKSINRLIKRSITGALKSSAPVSMVEAEARGGESRPA